MKKLFLEPEVEVIKFGTEDVITTSTIVGPGEEGELEGGETEDPWA